MGIQTRDAMLLKSMFFRCSIRACGNKSVLHCGYYSMKDNSLANFFNDDDSEFLKNGSKRMYEGFTTISSES
jgi:hypothetical protein